MPATAPWNSSVGRSVDTLLDRTIAFGYGNVGLNIRRHLPGWPADPPRMDGKVVLITGAGSGLGLAAAKGYAKLGATVLALGRDEERADEAVSLIRQEVPNADVKPVACDISNLTSIRELGERLSSELDHLDVLVNNAGVMPEERTRSAQGHELDYATHVLAPLALTAALQGPLSRSAPGRVINVSSGGAYDQSIPSEDLESETAKYGPKKFYARTKREEIVVTERAAGTLEGSGIVVHAMHPGWADTKGVEQWMPVFRAVTRPIIRTPEQGADTIVWLGGAPEPAQTTGKFWHDRRERPTNYLIGASADDPAERDRLWTAATASLREAGLELRPQSASTS